MQIYNKTFETTVTIPIKYTFIPDSIVFQDTLPQSISLRIKDDGAAMFRYYFSKHDTLRLDVSSIIKGGSNKVLQGTNFDTYIRRTLPLTSQVLSYDPIRISFAYSALESRKVPVIFDGQINLAPGYFLNDDIKISPDSVTAYGSRDELNKLMYAYTVSDTANGVNSSKRLNYNLAPKGNIKFSPHSVAVDIQVEAYTQKSIEVPVECINLPENLSVKFFPSKVKLSFYIGVSKVDSIREKDFSVAIDYDGLRDSKQVSVPVRLISSPNFARNLTITPPNVEFIFEYKNTVINHD